MFYQSTLNANGCWFINNPMTLLQSLQWQHIYLSKKKEKKINSTASTSSTIYCRCHDRGSAVSSAIWKRYLIALHLRCHLNKSLGNPIFGLRYRNWGMGADTRRFQVWMDFEVKFYRLKMMSDSWKGVTSFFSPTTKIISLQQQKLQLPNLKFHHTFRFDLAL